jgi:hypothetical protein
MAVVWEIEAGGRSVLSHVFDPLPHGPDESLRERELL